MTHKYESLPFTHIWDMFLEPARAGSIYSVVYGFVVYTVGHKHVQEKSKYSSYQKSPPEK